MDNVFEEPKEVKEKKKTKKEMTEEKKKILAERLVKAREVLKQKKEAKKGVLPPKDDNFVIEKATQGDAKVDKPKKKKKQIIIEEDVTSSDNETSSSEEEEIVVVKKKRERKSDKSNNLNNEKLDGIFTAINELVSYKKTKIEAKNNYLKYQEAKLKEKVSTPNNDNKVVKEQSTPTPAPTPAPAPAPTPIPAPIEEPPEIILPSYNSLGNSRFNKRGF